MGNTVKKAAKKAGTYLKEIGKSAVKAVKKVIIEPVKKVSKGFIKFGQAVYAGIKKSKSNPIYFDSTKSKIKNIGLYIAKGFKRVIIDPLKIIIDEAENLLNHTLAAAKDAWHDAVKSAFEMCKRICNIQDYPGRLCCDEALLPWGAYHDSEITEIGWGKISFVKDKFSALANLITKFFVGYDAAHVGLILKAFGPKRDIIYIVVQWRGDAETNREKVSIELHHDFNEVRESISRVSPVDYEGCHWEHHLQPVIPKFNYTLNDLIKDAHKIALEGYTLLNGNNCQDATEELLNKLHFRMISKGFQI